MQKIAPSFRSFRAPIIAGAALLSACLAGQALAECEEAEEAMAGKAVAAATAAKVTPAVAITGKQMLDISECNIGGSGIVVVFKYNFLGADGLYWVQGSAKVRAGTVSDLKVMTMSPNLSAATAAKGVKLASN